MTVAMAALAAGTIGALTAHGPAPTVIYGRPEAPTAGTSGSAHAGGPTEGGRWAYPRLSDGRGPTHLRHDARGAARQQEGSGGTPHSARAPPWRSGSLAWHPAPGMAIAEPAARHGLPAATGLATRQRTAGSHQPEGSQLACLVTPH